MKTALCWEIRTNLRNSRWFLGSETRTYVFCRKERLQVPVLPKPVRLRREITVHYVAFFVLKWPRGYDQDVPFTDPDAFLDLSLNPPHPGDTVITFDSDVVCPLHQFGKRELFIGPFFGEAHADGRGAIFVYGIEINIVIFLGIIANRNNSCCTGTIRACNTMNLCLVETSPDRSAGIAKIYIIMNDLS